MTGITNVSRVIWIVFLSLFFSAAAYADNREVNLIVGYTTVHFAGKARQAIAVNQQIPAPTLHFKEGDHVTINVYNRLNKETAIHWHGMLVPWQMDGVLGVTQRGIPSGGVFKYHFTLKQAGTYWYHSHAGLQEQQGLYGAFVIEPLQRSSYKYTKDYPIVLSDWSNTHPDQILANLKKDGDYYAPNFPLQASLLKFIHDYRKANLIERQKLFADYKMMQQMRMSIYDISDVAYDAFLMNGHPATDPWTAVVKVGDVVRLRFIGAGAETMFHIKIPGTSMQVVHIDGNNIQPYTANDLIVTPGETYDVLVNIKQNKPYIIYAESADTVGAAIGALVTMPHQYVDYKVTPFAEPLPVTRDMMANMMATMGHEAEHMSPTMTMSHGAMPMHKMAVPMKHVMPTESQGLGDHLVMPTSDLLSETTVGTKYQQLKAAVKTNDDMKPVSAVIRMELFGYMGRFIWFINGVPEYIAKPIILNPAKRYRFIFTNNSMMHHPMHIHGHWFILRNGHGGYDPLLHTIDVAPGSRVVADLDTDASGQWLFHCHMLYHMMSGMSRVFQYSTLIEIIKHEAKPQNIVENGRYLNRPLVRVDEAMPIDVSLVKHPMAHHHGFYFASYLEGGEDPFHDVQEFTFKGLYGGDYHKLELLTEDAEINRGEVEDADIDIFYWHLISQFWAVKGGVNYFNRPAIAPYWQVGMGIEGLMPYYIDTNIRAYYYDGSAKLDIDLARDTQITNNFFIRLGIRSILATKTVERAQIGSGLNQMRYIIRPYYRLLPGFNVFTELEYQRDYGEFRVMQGCDKWAANETTLTLGLSWLL